jgi:glycosyltransferase involved in cell wall biosynthesis
LGLAERVKFIGEVPFNQVPEFLAAMDICVLPSLSEGMSNTLLEYMAAGKPVVATSVGGNPELVDHEVNGFLIPPSDHQTMADKLLLLLNNPELRFEMGVNARNKVKSEFGVDAMIKRYEDLFLSI